MGDRTSIDRLNAFHSENQKGRSPNSFGCLKAIATAQSMTSTLLDAIDLLRRTINALLAAIVSVQRNINPLLDVINLLFSATNVLLTTINVLLTTIVIAQRNINVLLTAINVLPNTIVAFIIKARFYRSSTAIEKGISTQNKFSLSVILHLDYPIPLRLIDHHS